MGIETPMLEGTTALREVEGLASPALYTNKKNFGYLMNVGSRVSEDDVQEVEVLGRARAAKTDFSLSPQLERFTLYGNS